MTNGVMTLPLLSGGVFTTEKVTIVSSSHGSSVCTRPMNIFFLSADPRTAAQSHCDRHVVKMILESTQLLWTAQHVIAGEHDLTLDLSADAPTTATGQRGYKPTHRNHPCAIWARATLGNYRWLCALAAALLDEYHYRYSNRQTEPKPHACESHVAWLTAHPPAQLLLAPNQGMTLPALAMPDRFKISPSPTACYKAFYLGEKRERGLLTYTRRAPPHWVAGKDGVRWRFLTSVRPTSVCPTTPKTTAPSKDGSCRHQHTSNSLPEVARTPI